MNLNELKQAIAEAIKNNNPELYLCWAKISEKGVKEIIKMLETTNIGITTLNLYGSKIGDKGAKKLATPLKKNTIITALSLYGNNIGDKGAKKLATPLKKNTTLTALDLSNNNIGDAGAKKILKAMKKNTTIITLNLSGNKISPEIRDKIGARVQQNQETRTSNMDKKLKKSTSISSDSASIIHEYLGVMSNPGPFLKELQKKRTKEESDKQTNSCTIS